MTFVTVDIGVHTADAEDVAVQFTSGDLVLTFVDWQEQPRRKVFGEVRAFRWQEFDEEGIRDDVVYEVRDSDWLAAGPSAGSRGRGLRPLQALLQRLRYARRALPPS